MISAVSFQPIFKKDYIDLELTFLATKTMVEGSGMTIWLIYEALKSLSKINFNNIYVQSCKDEPVLEFYHKLGKCFIICHIMFAYTT